MPEPLSPSPNDHAYVRAEPVEALPLIETTSPCEPKYGPPASATGCAATTTDAVAAPLPPPSSVTVSVTTYEPAEA